MNKMSTRKAATLATVLLMALMGCQSNSPTEPSTGGGSGGSGGGGNTPPTSDIAITLTASNLNPVAGSSTVITARATTGGNNVVNGTAIEFATTFGTFTETGATFALRTTANGAATVTLTSATVGTALVTARLGTVSRTITITFRLDDSGGGGTGPTLSSVTPSSGPPAGQQLVTISGTNLKAPVRVFFGAKEATVVSSTETQIKVLTPAVDLGASSQSLTVDVRVITESGTSNEGGATLANAYRYELQILTPSVTTLSPTTGPNEGNTRIVIFGEGFQSPVKVFFGSGDTEVEVEVISVTFSQIQAITPPAAGLGSAFNNASVSIRVLNVASNKQVTYPNAFRYGPKIQITQVSPIVGSFLGGTRVTINGFGFDDPVNVQLGQVQAQVIRVSGTEIVVIAGVPQVAGCLQTSGEVRVTNVEDGQTAAAPSPPYSWTYLVDFPPAISNLSPTIANQGETITVDILNPGNGQVKFTVGGVFVSPSPSAGNQPTGTTRFSFPVPTVGLIFDTQPCVAAGGADGEQNIPTDLDVVFESSSGCEARAELTVVPIDTSCVVVRPFAYTEPTPIPDFVATIGGASDIEQFRVCNGSTVSSLTIPAQTIAVTGTDSVDWTITGATTPLTLTPGSCGPLWTLTFTPTPGGIPRDAEVRVITNGGTLVVDLNGIANP